VGADFNRLESAQRRRRDFQNLACPLFPAILSLDKKEKRDFSLPIIGTIRENVVTGFGSQYASSTTPVSEPVDQTEPRRDLVLSK